MKLLLAPKANSCVVRSPMPSFPSVHVMGKMRRTGHKRRGRYEVELRPFVIAANTTSLEHSSNVGETLQYGDGPPSDKADPGGGLRLFADVRPTANLVSSEAQQLLGAQRRGL
jgi:hypothetical protein